MTPGAAGPGTVVLQSYRTERVEPLISMAMATVRQWAAMCGYAYEFVDDSFFDVLSTEFRERTQGAMWQISDMARLIHLQRLLRDYERAVWIDADMVVLDAHAFRLPDNAEFFFCREHWLENLDPALPDQIQINWRVNNSLCGFRRGALFLDWLRSETERATFAAPPGIDWNSVPLGTRILTSALRARPFPLYEQCGIISPGMYRALRSPDLARGVWRVYAGATRGIAAINMSLSMVRGNRVSEGDMLQTLGLIWSLNAGRPGWSASTAATTASKPPPT